MSEQGARGPAALHVSRILIERVSQPLHVRHVWMCPPPWRSSLGLPFLRLRFDAATKEIVLRSNRYPTREENRRLCLEQLHLLLHEGMAGAPLPVDSAFLREKRSEI